MRVKLQDVKRCDRDTRKRESGEEKREKREWERRTGARFVLRQSRARFKIFTQRDVRALRRSISPLFQPRVSYIDRCADELVDAFIAVPVTSLFRDGALPSHDHAALLVSRILSFNYTQPLLFTCTHREKSRNTRVEKMKLLIRWFRKIEYLNIFKFAL